MKVKAIVLGATGMVGEGVLLECLGHPDVEQVLVINRRPGGVSHPKLREIVHADLFNLAPIEAQLGGNWTEVRGRSALDWNDARPATRDAYERLFSK